MAILRFKPESLTSFFFFFFFLIKFHHQLPRQAVQIATDDRALSSSGKIYEIEVIPFALSKFDSENLF